MLGGSECKGGRDGTARANPLFCSKKSSFFNVQVCLSIPLHPETEHRFSVTFIMYGPYMEGGLLECHTIRAEAVRAQWGRWQRREWLVCFFLFTVVLGVR